MAGTSGVVFKRAFWSSASWVWLRGIRAV